jgi:hypothetical protein
MTTTTDPNPQVAWSAVGEMLQSETMQLPVVRRARGLRVPVLPSGTLLAQLAGGVGMLAGVYLQWGMAITLIVGGVAVAVLGMLKEAGKV